MKNINWKDMAIVAAVATVGAGLLNQLAGSYINKLPMASTDILGVTVGGFVTVYAALLIYDKFKK